MTTLEHDAIVKRLRKCVKEAKCPMGQLLVIDAEDAADAIEALKAEADWLRATLELALKGLEK